MPILYTVDLALLLKIKHTAYHAPFDIVDQVEEALEQLSTVGGVSVFREDVAGSLYGFEYAVIFQPWGGHDLEHFLNYGDMPAILVRSEPTKLQLIAGVLFPPRSCRLAYTW